jgi:VWFA-related protein
MGDRLTAPALPLGLLFVAAALVGAQPQQAPPALSQVEGQTGQPTFRSGVQIVEVDVRVFDKDGRFVRDLTRDEFEVLEKGVPQPLQTLYLVAEPERVGRDFSPASPDAGLKSRATGPTAEPPASARQTWIFLFDLNHLTPGGGFDRARRAVEEFIAGRFKDGDLAGVVAGAKMINNRLTSVREELVNAVKTVKPLVETRNRQLELTREWPKIINEDEALRIARDEREALDRAVMRACTEEPDLCKMVPPDLQLKEKARRFVRETHRATMETLTAMNGLASGLARIPGPKTIVFLTDGFVIEEIETTLRNVVGQTARAGGRVYAIDVRGLNRGRSAASLDQAVVTDEAGAFTGFDAGEDGPNSLAVDTGGMMIRNENNIGRALDTIARDSGQYYVLGYQPADANFDGKFRPIEVRVKRSDVRVRARRGYLALEPSKMLIPRPITSEGPAAGLPDGARTAKAREGGEPGSPDAGEPGDRGAGAPAMVEPRSAKVEPPGVTATGTVVTAPPPASSMATTRLRPNVDETLKSLAGAETAAAAGDLAKKGWDAYQRGDVENALVSFTAAAEQADVRPWVLYALGLSQVALARPLDAVASWERVRAAVPEFEPVYIDLADTYVQLSDLTKALAVLRDAEKRWPTDAEIHNAIGVIHFRRGALDDAIDAFARATAVQPEDALGYYNLGRAYEMRFARGQRYVSSQRKWVAASQDDRRRAEENYERCVRLGGPYAQDAADAISRLQWSKK